MSTIQTLSKFYYGHTVTSTNKYIDFKEGAGGEITAILNEGNYTPTEYAVEIKRAMEAVGALTFTVTFTRSTQKITIAAGSNYSLLIATGTNVANTAFTMMGFTGADLGGATTRTGNNVTGSFYYPQYIVDKYISETHGAIKENATVNSTPNGLVNQISFGDGARIEMNIRIITNKTGLIDPDFYENASGVSDFLTFMTYLLKKSKVEFMPDKDTPATFVKCYLESTPEDKDARKFTLKNMKFPDFYESGVLTFRKILV